METWGKNGLNEELKVNLGGKQFRFDIKGGTIAQVGVNYEGESAGHGFNFSCGTMQQGKLFVKSTIEQFEKAHPVMIVNVARHLSELSSTWKTGFVQGTCECANIVKEKDLKLAKSCSPKWVSPKKRLKNLPILLPSGK
ncbi:MAG: hypothetical protein LBG42_04185 [Treponema sp.]|jgi:hypothetical protein|nr:hypothetical protein [Treponema sp.]